MNISSQVAVDIENTLLSYDHNLDTWISRYRSYPWHKTTQHGNSLTTSRVPVNKTWRYEELEPADQCLPVAKQPIYQPDLSAVILAPAFVTSLTAEHRVVCHGSVSPVVPGGMSLPAEYCTVVHGSLRSIALGGTMLNVFAVSQSLAAEYRTVVHGSLRSLALGGTMLNVLRCPSRWPLNTAPSFMDLSVL
ncbi:hypothetical protein J6590_061612 [Homalodisca vitripennis]|nr:hypothetical protein J6590_061612 [Homalodisca vitripennis]